jgi:hypothetical protein
MKTKLKDFYNTIKNSKIFKNKITFYSMIFTLLLFCTAFPGIPIAPKIFSFLLFEIALDFIINKIAIFWLKRQKEIDYILLIIVSTIIISTFISVSVIYCSFLIQKKIVSFVLLNIYSVFIKCLFLRFSMRRGYEIGKNEKIIIPVSFKLLIFGPIIITIVGILFSIVNYYDSLDCFLRDFCNELKFFFNF